MYGTNFLIVSEAWPSRYVQHFWTLAIEEQFYLVWPFLVFLLPRRRLIVLCVGVVIGAAVLRGFLYDGGGTVHAIFTHTLTRADSLIIGAVVALLLRDPVGGPWLRRLAPWVLGAVLPVALVFLFPRSSRPVWVSWGLWGQVFGYPVVALTCAATIGWSVTSQAETFQNRFLGNSMLRFFGRYSYGMYVFHLAIDGAARDWNLHAPPIAERLGAVTPALIVYLAFAGVATLGLALLSWHLLEKRCLALKRYFVPSDKETAPYQMVRIGSAQAGSPIQMD